MSPENDELSFGGHARNLQYTAKVAKLSNQTESGIARVFADESENFLERQYGRLFIAMELAFTADAYDVTEVIAETMQREFYADLNKSVLESFEHALTAVNQTLADLAAEGQNDWVGKLNAVVGVLHENEVHVTQIGTASAYMVRGHSSTDITEGLSDQASGATAKTFINVASGDLEVGDKILATTDEVLNHLSIIDIRRQLYLHPPARAIRKVADQMLTKGMPDRLAAAVLEVTTIDLISNEPVSHDPDEIVLGAPRRHFETLQRFKRLRKDTPLAAAVETGKKYYDKNVKPTAAKTLASARARVDQLRGREAGPAAPRTAAGTPETRRQPRTEERRAPQERATEIGRSAATTARQVVRQASQVISRAAHPLGRRIVELWRQSPIPRSAAWQKITAATRPLTSRLARLPVKRFFTARDKVLYRNLILLFVVILALGLGLSIRSAQAKKEDQKVRDQIKVLQTEQAKAETNYVLKDFDGARRQLTEVKTQADQLSTDKRLKNEVAGFEASLAASFDRINNVVAVADQPLADFTTAAKDANPSHLALSGVTIYAIGDQGGLFTFNQTAKQTALANANPGIAGTIKATTTTSNGTVLFLTDQPSVFQLDATTQAIAEAPLTAGSAWEPGIAIDTVQQNVFVLEPGKNQVWKHVKTLSAFEKGGPFLPEGVDLKNAVDLVSGNAISILKDDGTVLRFVGGAQQAFQLAPPPTPTPGFSSPRLLAGNAGNDNLYIADTGNKRVLEYNGQGQYVRQFKLDAFGEARDMALDEKSNTLFVLAGPKLYQIGLATP